MERKSMDKRTVARELNFRGIGIHSGKVVDLALKPSDSGAIVFKRADREGPGLALDPRATGARNSSFLESGDVRIETVEHLLAALHAFGVDSLLVEISGAEIPILDGSAQPFADALADAGTRPAGPGGRVLRVRAPFSVSDGAASLEVAPDDGLRIAYVIEFDHPAIGTQAAEFRVTAETFRAEIAPARTFGFLKDVPELRRRGLSLGGSFANALVFDDEKLVNGPLRFPDEYVRHKILDLVGDLYLLGVPVRGSFKARKAGHALHIKAVRHLLDHPECREFLE
jgi:UDP-3-O-[3-hydroxymyristoyl] N-acetylglucosamine deacetylase